MNLLSVSNLEKFYNGENLFQDVSFTVEKGDKIGLIGVNGAGKTTLFKIISKEEVSDKGEIFLSKETKIGYLKQHAFLGSEKTLYSEVQEVFSKVIAIEDELNKITSLINEHSFNIEKLIEKQAELTSLFEKNKGYEYKSIIDSTLIGLGFSTNDFDRPINTLSGGQKTRVMLAKILLSDCNLLLLDEPTNHLDINSVNYLESFLNSYKGAVIIISHDRFFLDRVTSKTFHLELSKLTTYKGNYTAFTLQKELNEKSKTREYQNKLKEIKKLEASAELLHSFNREKSVKRAESKEKQIEKLTDTLEKTETIDNSMHYNFSPLTQSGKEVLSVENLSKSFDNNNLFSDIQFTIYRGEKIFLLGENGCGKTTLLRILLGKEKEDTGIINLGYHVEISYYEQTLSELNNEKDVISEVWDDFPKLNNQEIRNVLARFLFKGDDVFKQISTLSGGERARVVLVKILLKKSNFLILDEPTNHLDIDSREALENALSLYDGTILAVSHDRYFINKLASSIYSMNKNGITIYKGDYNDYILNKKPETETETSKKTISINAINYKNKKEIESIKRKRENALKKIEEEIKNIEAIIEEKNNLMYSESISTNYQKVMDITKEIENLTITYNGLISKWEKMIIESENEVL